MIADESKCVPVLGRFPLPVEIAPFGAGATLRAMHAAIAAVQTPGRLDLRQGRDGHAFVTDGGHWIVDAALGRIEDPAALARALAARPGGDGARSVYRTGHARHPRRAGWRQDDRATLKITSQMEKR